MYSLPLSCISGGGGRETEFYLGSRFCFFLCAASQNGKTAMHCTKSWRLFSLLDKAHPGLKDVLDSVRRPQLDKEGGGVHWGLE